MILQVRDLRKDMKIRRIRRVSSDVNTKSTYEGTSNFRSNFLRVEEPNTLTILELSVFINSSFNTGRLVEKRCIFVS